MAAKPKIPNHLDPKGKAPQRLCERLRNLEREASKLQTKYDKKIKELRREAEDEVEPLQEKMRRLMQVFLQKNNLPSTCVFHSESGYIVAPYPQEMSEKLSVAPEMDELEDVEDNECQDDED